MKHLLSISSRDLFKLILIGSAGFYVPISILMGVLALFEVVPANLNGESYVGLTGFFIQVAFSPLLVLLLASMKWFILIIGIKLFNFAAKVVGRRSPV